MIHYFWTDKVQKDLEIHSAVGALHGGPRKLENTIWPLQITPNTLTKIATLQSPCIPLMARRPAAAAPPQSQPGARPLGWAGGLSAAPDLQKILSQRKKLAQVAASSTAWPSLWPWIASAARRRCGGSVVESRISRNSRRGLAQHHPTERPDLPTSSPPRPARWRGEVLGKRVMWKSRLTKKRGLASLSLIHSYFPSPPRQARSREAEGSAQKATARRRTHAPRQHHPHHLHDDRTPTPSTPSPRHHGRTEERDSRWRPCRRGGKQATNYSKKRWWPSAPPSALTRGTRAPPRRTLGSRSGRLDLAIRLRAKRPNYSPEAETYNYY
jgi:hypothetical protein